MVRVQWAHDLLHTAIFFVDFNMGEIASLPNNANTHIYYCGLLQEAVINLFQNVAAMQLRRDSGERAKLTLFWHCDLRSGHKQISAQSDVGFSFTYINTTASPKDLNYKCMFFFMQVILLITLHLKWCCGWIKIKSKTIFKKFDGWIILFWRHQSTEVSVKVWHLMKQSLHKFGTNRWKSLCIKLLQLN